MTADAARFGLSPAVRRAAAAMLLVVGVQFWLIVGGGIWGDVRQLWVMLLAMAVAVVVVLVPAARRVLDGIGSIVNGSGGVGRYATAVGLAVLAAGYLYATARQQERPFAPAIHDDHSYLIQSRMLAAGRLWMPRHGLAEFFDSFHLITAPIYASKYPPGAALFYAPALRIGLPPWAMSLALSAASVGMLYLLLTELFDGVYGLLGVGMLLACTMFRRTSIEVLAQPPMLFLMLVAWLALVRWWRRTCRRSR